MPYIVYNPIGGDTVVHNGETLKLKLVASTPNIVWSFVDSNDVSKFTIIDDTMKRFYDYNPATDQWVNRS